MNLSDIVSVEISAWPPVSMPRPLWVARGPYGAGSYSIMEMKPGNMGDYNVLACCTSFEAVLAALSLLQPGAYPESTSGA